MCNVFSILFFIFFLAFTYVQESENSIHEISMAKHLYRWTYRALLNLMKDYFALLLNSWLLTIDIKLLHCLCLNNYHELGWIVFSIIIKRRKLCNISSSIMNFNNFVKNTKREFIVKENSIYWLVIHIYKKEIYKIDKIFIINNRMMHFNE